MQTRLLVAVIVILGVVVVLLLPGLSSQTPTVVGSQPYATAVPTPTTESLTYSTILAWTSPGGDVVSPGFDVRPNHKYLVSWDGPQGCPVGVAYLSETGARTGRLGPDSYYLPPSLPAGTYHLSTHADCSVRYYVDSKPT